jgi:ribosomal protein S6E (S10)
MRWQLNAGSDLSKQVAGTDNQGMPLSSSGGEDSRRRILLRRGGWSEYRSQRQYSAYK